MKNAQQLRVTLLFLFTFFSFFQLILAQNPPSFTVNGHVSGYSFGSFPQDIEIYVNGALTNVVVTGNGNFSISTNESSIKVELKQKNDYLNGVNVGDIIRIQNQIVGKTLLDAPYKLIAGDVNSDDKLSISDVVLIRKLILGINNSFMTGSWIFIDGDFQLTTLNWNQVNKYIEVNTSDSKVIQFKAIKLGDVN